MNKNIVRDQNLSTEEQALPREIELTDTALESVHGGLLGLGSKNGLVSQLAGGKKSFLGSKGPLLGNKEGSLDDILDDTLNQ